ncbi:adenylyl-sulfate kinase [Helicobacter jaachi]|nr:adenylyl-sulfate kinase [Helicobacter jaachi]
MIIWIMGLNGAGKTSTARELKAIFAQHNRDSLILDGKHLREIFEQNAYDKAARIALGIRYAQLAKTLSEQSNKIIIIAANGMLKEVCAYNRAHLQEYYEIFLDVPESVLQKRDSSGIYTRFKKGLVKNVGGLDLVVDKPTNAHLCVPYDSALSAHDVAQKIADFILSQPTQAQSKANPHTNIFGTKAKTLANLAPKLKAGKILPQWSISYRDFKDKARLKALKQSLQKSGFASFIVRSSASNEDSAHASNAGAYESVADVGVEDLEGAIKKVFASYDSSLGNPFDCAPSTSSMRRMSNTPHSQQRASSQSDTANTRIVRESARIAKKQTSFDDEIVLIQPFLRDILCAGVAFNTEPKTNAPYYVIEYSTKSTSAITAGASLTQTFFVAHYAKDYENAYIAQIVALLKDIESIIPNSALDVEFAITKEAIYCLQARPLIIKNPREYPSHRAQAQLLKDKIDSILKPHPSLYGTKGILGIMPDWNPAEIIGLHPRPLAFSLYAKLITDSVYATGRARYGYKDVSDNPLIYNLHGRAYVDVRASFNSFLPARLNASLGAKLIDYYLNTLRQNPQWHDKVEFEILFDAYYFDTHKRIESLSHFGFSKDEIDEIVCALKGLTNTILQDKIYEQDIAKLSILEQKREQILSYNAPLVEKIYWLLQDCKSYGTQPFVGLARMGFMAMGFLNTLVKEGILTPAQKHHFLGSLNCITTHFAHDLNTLPEPEFLRKYGHLRPGTYDILSPRYDENFSFYFKQKPKAKVQKEAFSLTLEQMRAIAGLLKAHNIESSVLEFFDFISMGITYREQSKFEFSKNLSAALSLISAQGSEFGLSAEDMSYCDADVFFKAYSTSNNLERLILESIEYGKSSYNSQLSIILPPLITSPKQVECFSLMESMPNFITNKRIQASVLHLQHNLIGADLSGKIVCISHADPGFDWIFSHNIAGLITEFGGVNSHMAIRANELGIPAIIGCGEQFERLANASMLDIDCANAKVVVL